MPVKGRVTSKDYQEPLRKPGEKYEPATAKEDDGAQKSASSTDESENGKTMQVILSNTSSCLFR